MARKKTEPTPVETAAEKSAAVSSDPVEVQPTDAGSETTAVLTDPPPEEILEGDDNPETVKVITGTSRVFRNGKLCIPGPEVEPLPKAVEAKPTIEAIDKEIENIEKALDDCEDEEVKQLEQKLAYFQKLRAEIKKPDPHKPKDVLVTSAHLVRTLKGDLANNRMTRLLELSRTDNDVKWLLAEFNQLTAPPEKND